jgi:MFS family permease
MTTPTPTATANKPPQRDLGLYWWGQTTSAFGSVFTAIAMPVIAVVHLDASPAQISLISAASILPMLLLGLPAGALADRIVRPRRTLIALDALSALAVGGVALGVANHVASIGWLIALAVVQGCTTILLEVLYFVHLRQLTDTAGIGPARARLQAGEYSAGFIGRLLVGPTIVVFGPAAALSVDAVSFALSLAALASMSPLAPMPRTTSREAGPVALNGLRSMGVGFRFFAGDSFHRALSVSLFLPAAAMAGTATLTAPFLLRVVEVPTGIYGALFAVSGLMGLAGSVLAGRIVRPPRDPRQITLAAFVASTVCAVLLPSATGPLPVAILCAALGISLPTFWGAIANVALMPVIVTDVSEDAMGRTVATLQVFGAAAGLVGALAGGALGEWIGLRQAIWALNVTALVAMALFVPPAFRQTGHTRSTPR